MAYSTPAPRPIPFDQIDKENVDLGSRFIHRIDDFGCYYVQLRARSEGKMHYGPAKTFYDNKYATTKYDGREKAFLAAVKFRDEHVWEFFETIDYDPTLRARQKAHAKAERERPKKFKIRKEAKVGMMSNLRYIRLIKRGNKDVRCMLEVTVNVHGRHFASKAYSYSFKKYGGKAGALRTAKKDRDRLTPMVQKKAELLNQRPRMGKKETREEIKSVQIQQTIPLKEFEPEKFIRRSSDNSYWIVTLRKKIHHYTFRPSSVRFNDADYDGKKYKSQIAARRYVIHTMTGLNRAIEDIKKGGITDHAEIEEMLESVVRKNEPAEKETTPVKEAVGNKNGTPIKRAG